MTKTNLPFDIASSCDLSPSNIRDANQFLNFTASCHFCMRYLITKKGKHPLVNGEN